jgi:DNA repair protein RadC
MRNLRKYTFTTKEIETQFVCEKKDTDIVSVAKTAKELIGDDLLIRQAVYAIYTDTKLNAIGFANIGIGGVSSSVVDLRLVMKHAIDTLASGIILVHNHPSGNLSASVQDKELTSKLMQACSLFGMQLLDSIIVTQDGYNSIII